MKLFNRISLLLISSLVFAACERDYDAAFERAQV